MVMRLYDWEALNLGHHAANFGGLRHCGSEDKTFVICYIISQIVWFSEGPGGKVLK